MATTVSTADHAAQPPLQEGNFRLLFIDSTVSLLGDQFGEAQITPIPLAFASLLTTAKCKPYFFACRINDAAHGRIGSSAGNYPSNPNNQFFVMSR